jgi:hypothetical protein
MIFQRINGGDAEKVFAIFYNVPASVMAGTLSG